MGLKNSLSSKICVATFSVALAACSGGVEGAPESEIEDWLTLEADAGFEVRDVELVVAENEGTQVEPVWRSRADVEFRLEEDFFERVGTVGDTLVLRKIASAGDVISGRMIFRSEQKADGEWDITLLRDDVPRVNGRAESRLGTQNFVEEGTDEHEQLIADQEVREADAAAAEQRRFEEAKAAFVGTWLSSQPLVLDDEVWSSSSGMQAGYRLELLPTDGSAGTGQITLFDFADPSDGVTSPVGYNVSEDGEYATVNVTRRVAHENMRDALARRTWRLSPDGEMRSRELVAVLEKQ